MIYTSRQPQAGPERRREHDSYAMVVDGGATEYREVLAKVRPVLQESGGEDVIRNSGFSIVACYVSPNIERDVWERVIAGVMGLVKDRGKPMLVLDARGE